MVSTVGTQYIYRVSLFRYVNAMRYFDTFPVVETTGYVEIR